MIIKIPISLGELVDKISILLIKKSGLAKIPTNIGIEAKLANSKKK